MPGLRRERREEQGPKGREESRGRGLWEAGPKIREVELVGVGGAIEIGVLIGCS